MFFCLLKAKRIKVVIVVSGRLVICNRFFWFLITCYAYRVAVIIFYNFDFVSFVVAFFCVWFYFLSGDGFCFIFFIRRRFFIRCLFVCFIFAFTIFNYRVCNKYAKYKYYYYCCCYNDCMIVIYSSFYIKV